MTITANLSLPATTHMGVLHLQVKDVAAMLDFYSRGVGLVPLAEERGVITLGLKERAVVALHEAPELRPASRRDAGLFHTAILFDSSADLAASLVRMFTQFAGHYTGAGDHLVSQAFYFTDPEGNGVELYVDRPRSQWHWINGQVAMDTLYIDPVDFVQRHLSRDADAARQAIDLAGDIGHVHLKVGNIDVARDFYVGLLGFNQTLRMGDQALFVSAGGYHHHMAMNTWNSRGAGLRLATLGLSRVDIVLDDRSQVERVKQRLVDHSITPDDDGLAISVHDPWGTIVHLTPARP